MSELDLNTGDPARAEASETPSDKRRITRTIGKTKKPPPPTGGRRTAAQKAEDEFAQRIMRCFERLAETFENRGDQELADIFREEQQAMSGGLVSATRSFTPFRKVVEVVLNVLDPLLSFNRLGKVLVRRWIDRRARKQAEYEAAMAEQQTENNVYRPAYQ